MTLNDIATRADELLRKILAGEVPDQREALGYLRDQIRRDLEALDAEEHAAWIESLCAGVRGDDATVLRFLFNDCGESSAEYVAEKTGLAHGAVVDALVKLWALGRAEKREDMFCAVWPETKEGT